MLIVSVMGVSAVNFVRGYLKTTYERDLQMKTVIANIDIAERLKAEVKTLPQLLAFSTENDIKLIAIGIGEVALTETADGIELSIISAEKHGFSERVQTSSPSTFRIVIGEDMPNTEITTIIRLEGG